MRFYEQVFIYLTYVWYILFAIARFELWEFAEIYLEKITFYLNILVSFTLLYYFNPLSKTKMTKTHKRMVFSAALFILTTEGLNNVIARISRDARNFVPKLDEDDTVTKST